MNSDVVVDHGPFQCRSATLLLAARLTVFSGPRLENIVKFDTVSSIIRNRLELCGSSYLAGFASRIAVLFVYT